MVTHLGSHPLCCVPRRPRSTGVSHAAVTAVPADLQPLSKISLSFWRISQTCTRTRVTAMPHALCHHPLCEAEYVTEAARSPGGSGATFIFSASDGKAGTVPPPPLLLSPTNKLPGLWPSSSSPSSFPLHGSSFQPTSHICGARERVQMGTHTSWARLLEIHKSSCTQSSQPVPGKSPRDQRMGSGDRRETLGAWVGVGVAFTCWAALPAARSWFPLPCLIEGIQMVLSIF